MPNDLNRQQVNIKNKTTKEKLSFFAVMLITVGSCIGAGIFFKNQSILSNTGSIIMTVVS
jgi:amino acid transporter